MLYLLLGTVIVKKSFKKRNIFKNSKNKDVLKSKEKKKEIKQEEFCKNKDLMTLLASKITFLQINQF